jgi:potassium efflux system protein
LLGVAAGHPAVADAPAPEVLFQAYQDSALELWLRLWMPDSSNWPTVRSELYYAIDRALREAGIEVPYPQRTVYLRSDGSSSGTAANTE